MTSAFNDPNHIRPGRRRPVHDELDEGYRLFRAPNPQSPFGDPGNPAPARPSELPSPALSPLAPGIPPFFPPYNGVSPFPDPGGYSLPQIPLPAPQLDRAPIEVDPPEPDDQWLLASPYQYQPKALTTSARMGAGNSSLPEEMRKQAIRVLSSPVVSLLARPKESAVRPGQQREGSTADLLSILLKRTTASNSL